MSQRINAGWIVTVCICLSTMAIVSELWAQPKPLDRVTVEVLKKKAKSGDLDTQLQLARNYFFGIDLPVNYPLARYWAAEASASQSPEAMVLLSYMLQQGLGGVKDLERAAMRGLAALPLITTQASSGDPYAQAMCGWLLSEGVGPEHDPGAAFYWAARSAKAGNSIGQNLLGTCYAGGIGVPKDAAEALLWYRLAANQNLPQACYNIGRLLAHHPKLNDPDEALKWWTKAAVAGHSGAQSALGVAYQEGRWVKHDRVEALAWLSLARAEDSDAARRWTEMFANASADERARSDQRVSTVLKGINGPQ